jgi:hypothetical protein
MKKPGKIVSFIDKEGITRKAVAYDHEQSECLRKYKKVYLHYMNDDLTPKMDNGKKVVGFKAPDQLKIIGFVD